MNPKILVVDDEENIRRILKAMLVAEGYSVVTVSSVGLAREELRSDHFHVVLSDLRLERENGLQLLRWMKEENIPTPVIILTAHGTVDSAVDAMKRGAFDYLSKPFERKELHRVIQKALLTYRFNLASIVSSDEPGLFVGKSSGLQKVVQLVDKVASSDATVLITGESGTGKELVAQAVHDKSLRREKAFIKINCAAIPETLLESELFGHEKGAFTGATGTKPGRFELADQGTLFLDEIGEMSPEMQVKLLRVLQEGSFERVGGIRTLQVDVRLITATNKNLEEEVRAGRFRSDLFYRLNVVPISVPPLRERRDDIPALIAFFAGRFATRLKCESPVFAPETLDLMTQYPWPGNIRQLENVVERVLVVNRGALVLPEYLPEEILEYEEDRFLAEQTTTGGLKERVREATRQVEKKAIEEALVETSQNVTRAARLLNISRKGLQLKMKELGLR